MSYHGARLNNSVAGFLTPTSLRHTVERSPHDVIITKTDPRHYAGPLSLATDPITVGGPDPEKPAWIVVLERQPDGKWKVR